MSVWILVLDTQNNLITEFRAPVVPDLRETLWIDGIPYLVTLRTWAVTGGGGTTTNPGLSAKLHVVKDS